jgi:hypothetical protein
MVPEAENIGLAVDVGRLRKLMHFIAYKKAPLNGGERITMNRIRVNQCSKLNICQRILTKTSWRKPVNWERVELKNFSPLNNLLKS